MSTKRKYNNKLANELRRLRGRLSKKKFAKMLGVEYPTYLRYESCKSQPKEPVMKLARILSKKTVYSLPEKPKVESSYEDEVDYDEPRPIDDLLAALRSILTNLDDRFTLIESRLAVLEEKKDITGPGTAEDLTGKKVT